MKNYKIKFAAQWRKKIKIWLQNLNRNQHITTLDIIIFLRQFATLTAAGIPIMQCCDLLEKSQEKISLRFLIYSIKKDLLAGKTLSNSLKSYQQYFDKLTCQLIQIGEHTGKLDTMLIAIANYHERKLAFNKRIRQALFYPSIITITAFVVTLCMLIFIIPRFAELFHETQEKLPVLTVWIFYLSTQLKQYILWLIASGVLCAFILFRNKHLRNGKHYLIQLLSTLPFIKKCIRKIVLARFARNLAITFIAGIPIIEALKLTANACGDAEFVNIIAKLRGKICAGLRLHCAMESIPYFPQLMTQMVKIGEESGNIEYMLDKMADFLESDIDQLLSYFSQLLEPLIMIILGVLIGGLVIGMYLPIFKLGNAL